VGRLRFAKFVFCSGAHFSILLPWCFLQLALRDFLCSLEITQHFVLATFVRPSGLPLLLAVGCLLRFPALIARVSTGIFFFPIAFP
jgi:hypothetical protein